MSFLWWAERPPGRLH